MKSKSFFPLLLVMLFSYSPGSIRAQYSDPIQEAASTFLSQKLGKQCKELTRVCIEDGIVGVGTQKTRGLATTKVSITAFNASGGGFAIVHEREGQPFIIGYSDKGSIDPATMPDAMKAWLTSYCDVSEDGTQINLTNSRNNSAWDGPAVNPVSPLIKTKWGQSAPFNELCPKFGSNYSKAGCTAVALAQILHHYKSQNKGQGIIEYVNTSPAAEITMDYSRISYDWDSMLDTYASNYTEEQARAVAKLVYEAGVACKTEYGFAESPGVEPFVALNKYFNYKCRYMVRSYYTYTNIREYQYDTDTKIWMETIQKELLEGRPILYSAKYFDRPSYSYIGHSFIIDGIDENNLLHINWGWSGIDDGYYDIAYLNPASSANEFDTRHSMIVGIEPRDSEVYQEQVYVCGMNAKKIGGGGSSVQAWTESTPSPLNTEMESQSVEVKNDYTLFCATSNSYDAQSFDFATVLVQNGEIKKYCHFYSSDVNGFPSSYAWDLPGDLSAPFDVEDGIYEIRLACKVSNTTTNYDLCPVVDGLSEIVEISENGTKVDYRNYSGYSKDDTLRVLAIEPVGEVYAGTPFYLRSTVKNKGCATLKFENLETGKIYGSGETITNDRYFSGMTQTGVTRFKPLAEDNNFSMPEGTYRIFISRARKSSESIPFSLDADEEDIILKVNPKPEYPVMEGYDISTITICSNYTNEKNLYWRWQYYFYPGFTYANSVAGKMSVNLYAIDVVTGEEHLITTYKDYNETTSGKLPLSNQLYPLEGQFIFKTRYATALSGEREDLCPEELKDRVVHNIISGDVNAKLSVSNVRNHYAKSLTAKFRNDDTTPFTGTIRAMFCNFDRNEVVLDSIENVTIEAGEYVELTFQPELSGQGEYDVYLYGKDLNNYLKIYSFATNEEGKIAKYVLDPNITDISFATSDNCAGFKAGETINVYTPDGIKVKQVIANDGFVRQLIHELPHGLYIIRSSTHCIKIHKCP